MKYLVLGCDPVGNRPLWEENELPGAAMPVPLPTELVAEILAWNEQMAGAVWAATKAASDLTRLNAEGESLAKRVAASVPEGAKIRYLSERFSAFE
jgi:hypothetical protein